MKNCKAERFYMPPAAMPAEDCLSYGAYRERDSKELLVLAVNMKIV